RKIGVQSRILPVDVSVKLGANSAAGTFFGGKATWSPATRQGCTRALVQSLWERGRMASPRRAPVPAPHRRYCKAAAYHLAGPNQLGAQKHRKKPSILRSRTPSAP